MISEQVPYQQIYQNDEAEKQATERIEKLITNKGTKPVDYFHKKLGKIIWNECGMSRNKKAC